MMLEREIQLLRSSKNENYVDEDRERFTILALQMRVNEYTDEVHQLENFIIQQDHVSVNLIINQFLFFAVATTNIIYCNVN